MKTRHNGRAGSVLLTLLLAAATVGHEAQAAATVTYVGADVSCACCPDWGTSWNHGFKKDFRSTKSSTKLFLLPGKPNAYGAGGYIMFGQSGASVTQEVSGDFTGTIYTGTRSGQTFSNPAPGIASVAILGTGGQGTGLPGGGYWRINTDWVGALDDASRGIRAKVADVVNGALLYRWNAGETEHALLRITLNGDPLVSKVRIGIGTAGDISQKPAAIGLNGVWQTRLGEVIRGADQPDWYFFDITNLGAGETVDISIKPHSGSVLADLRGLVFDVVSLSNDPPVSAAAVAAPDELAKEVEELTGGRTKIVWEGSTHLSDNPQGGKLEHGMSFIGYDTADGRSRVLSKTGGGFPFLTPDGNAVIFNTSPSSSKIVNWDGSNERWLVQGEYGWAHCAWVDPETKFTWIYVSDANRNPWTVDKGAFTKVFRVRLDKPDVREPIYETNRGGLWLFATPDGKRLWGGIRDSQEHSMLDIATKAVTVVVNGCDPSYSPTEDRFWAFTGTHRHMIMFDWKDGQAANRRDIQANTMPGVDGRKTVWHPRWSTHPRIFSIMGPEEGASQIYLGRFNPDFTAVDGWVQITDNKQWNGWSHAWVQTGPEKPVPPAKTVKTPAASTNAPTAQRPLWPADRRDLVFALRNGDEIANPPAAFDAAGKPLKDIVLKHTLWRHYGPNHELILSGSPAEAAGAAGFVAARAVQNRALTLLAGITPGAFEDAPPRRLLAILDGEKPVLSLVQTGARFSVTIAGPWAGGQAIVCPVPAQKEPRAFAFAITLRDGAASLYANGKPLGAQVLAWDPVRLTAPRLVFGDTVRQPRAAAPAVDSVALYARALTAADVAVESKRWSLERSARKAIPRLRLKGKLIRMAAVPDAAKIAPYTQALVVGEYEVAGVLQGEYKEKTVNVAHWGMLNRQRQPIADRKAGETFDLLVEPFVSQPQLEPEYLADTDRDPVGALYYDVEN